MNKIIAFAGRKQSGKTTCAEAVIDFVKHHTPHLTTKLYNFADPLKQDICINVLGLTYNQCYGTDEEKNQHTDLVWEDKHLSAREVMQFVGTDIFRKMKPNVWADATIQKIKLDQYAISIIADCRFPNEVDAVKNAGGIVIKLTRNPYNSDHISETALDPNHYSPLNFDYVLDNSTISIAQQITLTIQYLKAINILS